jgi:hypothetical protein
MQVNQGYQDIIPKSSGKRDASFSLEKKGCKCNDPVVHLVEHGDCLS